MTYEKIFADLKKTILKADASKLEGKFAFQCVIEGDGAGTFYIAFENGALSVEPYDYADNTATFKATGAAYKDILAGKVTVDEALASGALVVDGADGCADILTFFAFLSNNIIMPIVALVTCILIGYVAKTKYVEDEVQLNSAFKSKKMYRVMIKYVCPVFMVIIFISSVFGFAG